MNQLDATLRFPEIFRIKFIGLHGERARGESVLRAKGAKDISVHETDRFQPKTMFKQQHS